MLKVHTYILSYAHINCYSSCRTATLCQLHFPLIFTTSAASTRLLTLLLHHFSRIFLHHSTHIKAPTGALESCSRVTVGYSDTYNAIIPIATSSSIRCFFVFFFLLLILSERIWLTRVVLKQRASKRTEISKAKRKSMKYESLKTCSGKKTTNFGVLEKFAKH